MINSSHFLISATSSGSGKTTVTLGLLRAIRNRGLRTQPFKCGPDYIDTKYHDQASGRNSINLDLFLSSECHVRSIYTKYTSTSEVNITEGVMGLFDGYDKMEGSSARIAELLNIPVVLVINAKSMAYSAAAMLYGFKNFYKNINIVGAIFNFVASESHYNFLKEACQEVGIEALGYLPKNTAIEVPSRHLGLSLDKEYRFDEFADNTASLVEKYINIDRLLSITRRDVVFDIPEVKDQVFQNMRITVASDEAFNFVYHENIEYLKQIGIVTFFSPLKDTELPDADLVYLPGGYPELFLNDLSANEAMRQSINRYVESGGKLFAECGGMMYLSTTIADKDGTQYPMVDIFKQNASMENMKLKLGYRQFEYKGIPVKGHEFHYSSVENKDAFSIVQQYNAKGAAVDAKLMRYKNAIAGYTHLYWAENGCILDMFAD
ncbi:cobyrinate a,c-diamide synthase [Dysgonomonas sp. Marseille-P4677]|uniref:cobyrinate a,c-diamide synthase n=1 Tax=Dysgonomonas sp. Marseille-P4677 TaxID=2364790 RepID=UPI0019142D22|nr:cobyrinate a,c-diamide synthase [Dysgonomonas sp. Marseille-P4677]MBK5720377.1 cobyrinate a,c-diamide synthase [Dysgonomonas sp. Marseille-P4677]